MKNNRNPFSNQPINQSVIEYKYKTNKILQHKDVHSIIVELFGKDSKEYSTKSDKTIILIKTHKKLNSEYRFKTESGSVELKLVNQENFQEVNEKTIELESLVCYTKTLSNKIKNKNGQSRNQCLIGFKNEVDEEVFDHFCNLMGVKSIDRKVLYKEPVLIKNEFKICNCFKINLKVEIVDIDKFNHVLKYGIGQKKSYGFGLINLNKENK